MWVMNRFGVATHVYSGMIKATVRRIRTADHDDSLHVIESRHETISRTATSNGLSNENAVTPGIWGTFGLPDSVRSWWLNQLFILGLRASRETADTASTFRVSTVNEGRLVIARIAEFTAAVRRVGEGGSALDPAVVSQLVGRRRKDDPLATLTRREREVLELMAARPPRRWSVSWTPPATTPRSAAGSGCTRTTCSARSWLQRSAASSPSPPAPGWRGCPAAPDNNSPSRPSATCRSGSGTCRSSSSR